MKVAITGASGLIGQETAKLLSSLGHSILALGRDEGKLQEVFADPINITTTNYEVEDLGNKLLNIDAIIHLAAVRQTNTEQDFTHYIEGNLILTENLLKVCRRNHIQIFCFTSGIAVYSEKNTSPYREDQHLCPDNPYGISRLTAEYLVNLYMLKQGGRSIILRLPKVFGATDQSEKNFILTRFISQAIMKEKLVVWGAGKTTRDLIYVKDVAMAIARALEINAASETLNIGSGRQYSLEAIARTVNEVFNNTDNLEVDTTKPEGSRSWCLDSSLALEKLGWKAKWALKPALEDMRDNTLKTSK